jgi:MYXO-CTERM domain-containing protein
MGASVIRVAAFGLALLAWSDPAEACQCSPPDAASTGATLIIEGTVTRDAPRADEPALREVTLADVQTYRGAVVGAEVTLHNGSDCPPVSFATGRRYLLYLHAERGVAPTVTFCNRVVESASAGAEIAALGAEPPASAPAAPPGASDVPPVQGNGCASCAASGPDGSVRSPAWLAALLAGAALARRRRVTARHRARRG